MMYNFHLKKSEGLDIADIITATTALCAFFASLGEYEKHKERERFATLAEYNKRYSEDKYIHSCLNFLIGNLNNNKCALPSIAERELFFRFFEELQLQINAGRLEKEQTQSLFAYYGIVAFLDPTFSEGIIEFDSKLKSKSETSIKMWKHYYQFLVSNIDLAKDVWKERIDEYGSNLSTEKYQYLIQSNQKS